MLRVPTRATAMEHLLLYPTARTPPPRDESRGSSLYSPRMPDLAMSAAIAAPAMHAALTTQPRHRPPPPPRVREPSLNHPRSGNDPALKSHRPPPLNLRAQFEQQGLRPSASHPSSPSSPYALQHGQSACHGERQQQRQYFMQQRYQHLKTRQHLSRREQLQQHLSQQLKPPGEQRSHSHNGHTPPSRAPDQRAAGGGAVFARRLAPERVDLPPTTVMLLAGALRGDCYHAAAAAVRRETVRRLGEGRQGSEAGRYDTAPREKAHASHGQKHATIVHVTPAYGAGAPPIYGTFEKQRVVRKRLMSHGERLHFLRHGVQPPGARARVEEPMPAARDAATFFELKRRVLSLIDDREVALAKVYDCLPSPHDPAALSSATARILLDPSTLHRCRQRLVGEVHSLRITTAAVCDGVQRWRKQLRAQSSYYAALPDAELKFLHNGHDYMLKMTQDLSFLPAPVSSDPLLLSWFGETLPKILLHAESSLADAEAAGSLHFAQLLAGPRSWDDASEDSSSSGGSPPRNESASREVRFDPEVDRADNGNAQRSADADAQLSPKTLLSAAILETVTDLIAQFDPTAAPASSAALATEWASRSLAASGQVSVDETGRMWMLDAQAMILTEARRTGSDVSLHAAVRHARRMELHAGARAQKSDGGAEGTAEHNVGWWRWAAFQIVLYGSECYPQLIALARSKELDEKLRGAGDAVSATEGPSTIRIPPHHHHSASTTPYELASSGASVAS